MSDPAANALALCDWCQAKDGAAWWIGTATPSVLLCGMCREEFEGASIQDKKRRVDLLREYQRDG